MRVVISIAWHAAWHQVTPPNQTSSTEWEAIVQLGIWQNIRSDSGAHPATHWTNTRVPPSEVKQKGSQADHSPSSSAKGMKWRLQLPSVYACHWSFKDSKFTSPFMHYSRNTPCYCQFFCFITLWMLNVTTVIGEWELKRIRKEVGVVKPKEQEFLRRIQPTRCDVSQFIYFCKTLYMFQTGFPSIIRSSNRTYSVRYLSNQYCYLLLAWPG